MSEEPRMVKVTCSKCAKTKEVPHDVDPEIEPFLEPGESNPDMTGTGWGLWFYPNNWKDTKLFCPDCLPPHLQEKDNA